MDTNITARIADFRTPPPYPKLEAFEEKLAQGMTPDRLNQLDRLAIELIAGRRVDSAGLGSPNRALALFDALPTRGEQIYVALAANSIPLLQILELTIPEAIDRLGWVDASAMVARWRNRRA